MPLKTVCLPPTFSTFDRGSYTLDRIFSRNEDMTLTVIFDVLSDKTGQKNEFQFFRFRQTNYETAQYILYNLLIFIFLIAISKRKSIAFHC